MTSFWFEAGDGETPLDPDEAVGLRFDLRTRGELNELELANINQAMTWARGRSGLDDELLTVSGVLELHRRMFRDVWRWAGTLRTTEKSIGVAPEQVPARLKGACDYAAYWLGEGGLDPREAAVHFHHRLVHIHLFPNGNGRHARLVADLLVRARRAPALRWTLDREAYVAALRAADTHDFRPLNALLL